MTKLASKGTVAVCNSLRPSTLDALSELRAWRELRKSQIIGTANRTLVIASIAIATLVGGHMLFSKMVAMGNDSAAVIERAGR